jgi:DNA mismatch repair ATPase MutS
LLRWIKCPSCKPAEIEARLNGVTWFVQNGGTGNGMQELRDLLSKIKVDIVRVVRTSSIGPKHVSALVKSLRPMLKFFDRVKALKSIEGLNYPSNDQLSDLRKFIDQYAMFRL